jgi:ketosteroid isomerase-like protein
MDTQRTLELGQQFAETLHAVDRREEGAIERMVELFSPEARLTNASLKLAGEERSGRDGVRSFWENYQQSFQEAETEFFQLTSGERAAGLFWTTRGRDATGEAIEYDGVSLLVFGDDGKITLFRGYYDTRELSKKVSG